MPPPPEIVEGARLKRGLEVLDQVIAQNAGCTQRNVAAAGEIHVQLHGEQHGGRRQVRPAHGGNITVDGCNILPQIVGKDHLFGVAPQHAESTARAALVAEAAAFADLRAQLGVTLDRAVDQRGEEADKQCIVQRVRLDPAAALVDINGVAHGRKGKVAQPQRCQQIFPAGEQAAAQRVCQKVPVLVVDQNPDAEPDRGQQCKNTHRLAPNLADDEPAEPCDERCRRHDPDQRAVYGIIAEKAVACKQQKVRPQHAGQGIIDERHRRKKGKKQQRGDRHRLILTQKSEDLLPGYCHDSSLRSGAGSLLFFQVADTLFQYGVGLGQSLAFVRQLADGDAQGQQHHQHEAEHQQKDEVDRHLNVKQVAQHIHHIGEGGGNDKPDSQRQPEQAVFYAHKAAL